MDDVAIITLTLNPKMSLSEPKYKQFPTFVSAKKLNPGLASDRAFIVILDQLPISILSLVNIITPLLI